MADIYVEDMMDSFMEHEGKSPRRGGKRRRDEESEDDLDNDGSEPDSKRAKVNGGNPIQTFAFTWTLCPMCSQPDDDEVSLSLDDFKGAWQWLKSSIDALMPGQMKYIFQLECPPNTSNWHYQGMFAFPRNKRQRVGQVIEALRYIYHGIHITPAVTSQSSALRNYCMKLDTRQGGPWADHELPKVFSGKGLPGDLWPWQTVVAQEFAMEPDDRTINWIVDPEGKKGKSVFAKKMVFEGKVSYHTIADHKDTAVAVVKEGAKRAYLFDFPRTKTKKVAMDDIYTMLEQIKNGMVRAQKWENQLLLMDSPHVWVFANFPPRREAFSADRLKVWGINDDKRLVPFKPPTPTYVDVASGQRVSSPEDVD